MARLGNGSLMPPSGRTLSVVVPALNEEANLALAVAEIQEQVPRHFDDYEILIIDDGSTDRTGAVADALAAGAPRVKAFHNGVNRGLGFSYFRGVAEASKEYVVLVSGDRENSLEGMAPMWPLLGSADIIVPHTANARIRSRFRRAVSLFGTRVLNVLFGLDLLCYTGTVVHRTAVLRTVRVESADFLYQAETLVRLARRGCSIREVGVDIRVRSSGRSKMFRPRNLWGMACTVVRVVWKIRILDRP